MFKMPRTYADTAALAVSVAKNWEINHPNYVSKYADYQTLAQQAQVLEQKTVGNKNKTTEKAYNTLALAAVNERINAGAALLKQYIRIKNRSKEVRDTVLSCYGFVERKKHKVFDLPNDNDKRALALKSILEQLQQTGNPYADTEVGLAFWTQLEQEHRTAWAGSKDLKAGKTVTSRSTRQMSEEIRQVLEQLAGEIRLDFQRKDAGSVMREFGFLAEVYQPVRRKRKPKTPPDAQTTQKTQTPKDGAQPTQDSPR